MPIDQVPLFYATLCATLRPLLELTLLGHAGLPCCMHLGPTALAVFLGMFLLLRRVCIMTVARCRTVDGSVFEQPSLCEDRLASRDRSAKLPRLGRRCKLFGLRLNAQTEERLGGVLPDEPDLLLAHVPEFSYLRHDR